jgi:phosphoribosylamine--glycine ligase
VKILVIGSGGREHAIIHKLKENPDVSELYALPGNGGIAMDAICVPGKATDSNGAVRFAKEHAIDFVVVTPDDPLCLGMTDALEAAGISAFGPTKAAAVLEGSKIFAKTLMRQYGIPTADWQAFDAADDARAHIRRTKPPYVVKADGLALGKGVRVCQTQEEAYEAVSACMEKRIFGASGERIIIEETLTGEEVSVMAFTDGETILPMVSAMDHKRAFDHDEGPNTGGMGAVAPNPFYTPAMAEDCMRRIFRPTIEAMNTEKRPFRGCLYFGLMLTANGPMVIEYNARFGDPEAQAVLSLLESDLLTALMAVREGKLSKAHVQFRRDSACCVTLASGGYPQAYQTNLPLHGLNTDGQLSLPGVHVFHAGVKQQDGCFVTNGGRVLSVVYTAETLVNAVAGAYQAAYEISFEGMHYRRDIGAKARRLVEEKEAGTVLNRLKGRSQ